MDEFEKSNPEPQKATTETIEEDIKEKSLRETTPNEKKMGSNTKP